MPKTAVTIPKKIPRIAYSKIHHSVLTIRRKVNDFGGKACNSAISADDGKEKLTFPTRKRTWLGLAPIEAKRSRSLRVMLKGIRMTELSFRQVHPERASKVIRHHDCVSELIAS